MDGIEIDNSVLRVNELTVNYGSAKALFGVSIELQKGSVLALLGPNGAGKSTLGRAISGLVHAAQGSVFLNGVDVTSWSAHRIRRAGLTFIPETRGIFRDLSVLDNLRFSVQSVRGKGRRRDAVVDAFDVFPILKDHRAQIAGSLSGGEQQMLALARAFAVSCDVLVADELSLGLAPRIVAQVFKSLDELRSRGVSLIIIEQFVQQALSLADECVILNRGVISWTGSASEANAAVLDHYLSPSPSEPTDRMASGGIR